MRKRGKKSLKPNKEKFFSFYNDESLTVEEIAQIFKVKPNTIYNWASQFYKENNENLSDKQIYNRLNYNKKGVKIV